MGWREGGFGTLALALERRSQKTYKTAGGGSAESFRCARQAPRQRRSPLLISLDRRMPFGAASALRSVRMAEHVVKQLLYKIESRGGIEDALMGVRAVVAISRPRSVLLHFFCGDVGDRFGSLGCEIMDFARERAREMLPDAQIIGVSTDGEICRADIGEPSILLSAFLFDGG